ncbi:MAG: hypothetical protein WC314_03800 [Vulcanimicrobiota bacterium]
MSDHQRIDAWSLAMMKEIVARIDRDPAREGLERARTTLRKWSEKDRNPITEEWRELLELPWEELRASLLDEGDEGQRLRSSAPFCGILEPRERLEIFQEYRATRPA